MEITLSGQYKTKRVGCNGGRRDGGPGRYVEVGPIGKGGIGRGDSEEVGPIGKREIGVLPISPSKPYTAQTMRPFFVTERKEGTKASRAWLG